VNEDLGNLINIPLGAGSELLMSKYSRNHEKEADELGIQIVADAGYDPSQLAIILNNLSREVETLTGEKEKFSYFNSHPITPDRVKYLEKEVSKLSIEPHDPITASHEDFLKKVEGVYFWDNPEEGIFKGDTFMHPDLGIYCIFPEGWSTFNSPTFIGAMDEKNERGMIYLGMADTNATPEYLGNEFVNKLKQKHQAVPERNEKITLNGLDAYIVSIMDRTDAEPVGIHHLWFTLNNNTYRVIGASYQSEYELLKKSANTLRPITDLEKESVKVPVLRFIAAYENETLQELNERSGNTWSIELTAVMNNISPDKPLEKGQWVKIARNEKYMNQNEK
jgi:predicted Zn-dependent protease